MTTVPLTSPLVTDENGRAILENVLLQPYTFMIRRGEATAYVRKSLSMKDGKIQEVELYVESQRPWVFITAPATNYYHDVFNLSLRGTGYDFEDGSLPSNAFTWYSDIDGMIGTGNDLSIDRLSIGVHTITLFGSDSDGNTASQSTQIILYSIAQNTYFPIPIGGIWTYSSTPQAFTIYNEKGEPESYTLMDVQTYMENVNVRTSKMTYMVVAAGQKSWYEYTVSDYLYTNLDAFFVTKTIEHVKQWENDPSEHLPAHSVTITTKYETKYPLFIDQFDPSDSFKFTTTADVVEVFDEELQTGKSYKEKIDVASETSFLGYETITTELGAFDTAKVRIVQGETERIWWLAKNYGIVQFAYNSFGAEVVSKLVATSLAGEWPTAKSADQPLIKQSPHLSTRTDSPDNEEMRRILRISRSMAP